MADDGGIRVLGPVRLVGRDGAEVVLRGHAGRLLAALAISPGVVLTVDELVATLWPGGPPATARTALQGHVSRLRRALDRLDDVRIETLGGGYALRADRAVIDACRFVDLVARARDDLAAGRPDAAVASLRTALDLWSGPALGDVGTSGPLGAAAVTLTDARRDAEEHLVDALIDVGDLPGALALAGRLVNEEPLRERRWCQLVVALTRTGRQADALRACRQAAAVIVERTGLDPGPELAQLEMAVLVQDPALASGRWTPPAGSVPVPLVALVGRDREHDQVRSRLRAARMVTLVGLGGIGKTTLAIAVAASEAARRADGAVLVDLACSSPEDVANTIAAALGAVAGDQRGPTQPNGPPPSWEPLHRAAGVVRTRDVLVVLDNCDHVVDAAADAAIALLRSGPRVSILATSQSALGVPGESIVRLAPLDIPPPGAGPEDVRRSPAGALLARRLDEQGHPVLDDGGWQAVGELARALDGVPLALEIAAAAARTETVERLAGRLSVDAAAVLDTAIRRPGRPGSLRAVLDAAVAHQSPATVRLFAATGVIPGGFTAELAAAVAGVDHPAASAALRTLAEASLVVTDGSRIRLLQPVRAYARELLDPDDERAALDRLARWCIAEAHLIDDEIHGPGQDAAVDRFLAHLPAMRAGLRHMLDRGRVADAAETFQALASCWSGSPRAAEAPAWGDELLRHAGELPPGPRARLCLGVVRCEVAFDRIAARLPVAEQALADAEQAGDAWLAAGARISVAIGLAWPGTELDRAARLLDEAREAMVELGDDHWAAVALEFQGLLALRRLDVAGAVVLLEQALAEHRRVGAPSDIAHTLTFIGFARRLVEDPAGARRAFEEARRLVDRTRVVTWLRATAGAGYAALATGDGDGAGRLFREAHQRAVEVGDRRMASTALVGLAATARADGDEPRAVELLLAAARVALESGDPADGVTAAVELAEMLTARGHGDEAAVVLGAADALPTSAGVRVHFGLAVDPTPLRGSLIRHLGDEAFGVLARDGALLGLPAALERAADLLVDRSPVISAGGALHLADGEPPDA